MSEDEPTAVYSQEDVDNGDPESQEDNELRVVTPNLPF